MRILNDRFCTLFCYPYLGIYGSVVYIRFAWIVCKSPDFECKSSVSIKSRLLNSGFLRFKAQSIKAFKLTNWLITNCNLQTMLPKLDLGQVSEVLGWSSPMTQSFGGKPLLKTRIVFEFLRNWKFCRLLIRADWKSWSGNWLLVNSKYPFISLLYLLWLLDLSFGSAS